MIKKTRKRGFTIIELIVVIAVIAVLASIVLVSVTQYIQKSKDAKLRAEFDQIAKAIIIYKSNNGVWPDDVEMGEEPSFVPSLYPSWNASYYCSDCKYDYENWETLVPSRGDDCIGITLRKTDSSSPEDYTHGYPISETTCPGTFLWQD